MSDLGAQAELSPREPSRWFDLRLAAGIILLLPAIWFSWLTMDGLAERRDFRTDLAELEHVRYGLLSADQWRAIIGPILNAQVDKHRSQRTKQESAADGRAFAQFPPRQHQAADDGSEACQFQGALPHPRC